MTIISGITQSKRTFSTFVIKFLLGGMLAYSCGVYAVSCSATHPGIEKSGTIPPACFTLNELDFYTMALAGMSDNRNLSLKLLSYGVIDAAPDDITKRTTFSWWKQKTSNLANVNSPLLWKNNSAKVFLELGFSSAFVIWKINY